MGEANGRRRQTAAAVAAGQPAEVALGERSARRLSAFLSAAQGAEIVAQAAAQQAKAVAEKYQEAVAAVLDVHGVVLTPEIEVRFDPDRGLLVVGRRESAPPPPAVVAPAPVG